MEYDRNVVKNPSRPKNYISQLKKRLVNDGLAQPLILSVSKLTERAYIYEGNHRLGILLMENIEWIPINIHYYFLNDDNDERFRYIPQSMHGKWPEQPTPELLGFNVKYLAD